MSSTFSSYRGPRFTRSGLVAFFVGVTIGLLLICPRDLPAQESAAAENPQTGDGEDAGQESLDEAIEQRVRARSIEDLDKVIRLCETALEQGLGEENTKLAKEMLTYTLHHRAAQISRAILDQSTPDPRAPALRRFALRDLRKAIEYKQDVGQVHLLLARLLSLSPRDREAAHAAAQRAVELLLDSNEQVAQALVIRGRTSPDDQQRIADWNRAIKLDARNLDAWRSRGLYYLGKDEYEKALADLLKLLENDPKDIVAHQVVAEVLTEMKQFDKAAKHLDELIELHPKSAMPYTLRARVKIAQSDAKGALSDLNQGLEVQPRNVAALLMRSNVYNSLGDQDAALADVDRVMEIEPEMMGAIMQRSLIYFAQDRMTDAIADLRQLIRRDQDNVALHLQLAVYYLADKRPRKAIETYSSVLELQPDNLQAIRGRADALLAIGKQAEAIADYETVLKRQPNDSDVLNNLSWVLATSPTDDLRDGQRALNLAQQACEVTEYKKPHILSTLAAAYAETGDFDAAVEWSTKAVNLDQETKQPEQELEGQLAAELKSYQEKKPWRERQQVEDRKPAEEPHEDDLQVEE